jgi:hypothetical protein
MKPTPSVDAPEAVRKRRYDRRRHIRLKGDDKGCHREHSKEALALAIVDRI